MLYGTIQKLHSHHVTKISNRPQNQANHPYVPKLYQTNHLPQFFNQTKFASFRPPQSKVIQYNRPLSLSDTTGQMVKISNTHILSTTFLNHPQLHNPVDDQHTKQVPRTQTRHNTERNDNSIYRKKKKKKIPTVSRTSQTRTGKIITTKL